MKAEGPSPGDAIVRTARPAARILVVDRQDRLLLFRFVPREGAPFWATAGGKLDPGESYQEAARRELLEETGLALDPGPEVARRWAEFTTLEGEPVFADERYFLVRADDANIVTAGHTELERQHMTSWYWFSRAELANWPETIFPEDIVAMLDGLGA